MNNILLSKNIFSIKYSKKYNKNNFLIKKEYCFNYFIKNNCKGNCHKAHNKEELTIKILENYKFDSNFFVFHFKTEYCPLIDFKHNVYTCIYAHNKKEFRRCHSNHLRPKYCDKFKNLDRLNCKKRNYKFLHNNIEYEYHPFIYKNYKCENIKCIDDRNNYIPKFMCNKIHKSDRNILKWIESKFYFKLFPRNKNSFNFKIIVD